MKLKPFLLTLILSATLSANSIPQCLSYKKNINNTTNQLNNLYDFVLIEYRTVCQKTDRTLLTQCDSSSINIQKLQENKNNLSNLINLQFTKIYQTNKICPIPSYINHITKLKATFDRVLSVQIDKCINEINIEKEKNCNTLH